MTSEKVKKYGKLFGVILGVGLTVPVVLSFVLNGASRLYASNFVFTAGFLMAAAGAAGLVMPFSLLKVKLRRLKAGEELAVEKKEGLRWEYVFLADGAVLVLASYFIAAI